MRTLSWVAEACYVFWALGVVTLLTLPAVVFLALDALTGPWVTGVVFFGSLIGSWWVEWGGTDE